MFGPLGYWERGFESHSREGCTRLCVVLSCVARALVVGRSLVHGVVAKCQKMIHSSRS